MINMSNNKESFIIIVNSYMILFYQYNFYLFIEQDFIDDCMRKSISIFLWFILEICRYIISFIHLSRVYYIIEIEMHEIIETLILWMNIKLKDFIIDMKYDIINWYNFIIE